MIKSNENRGLNINCSETEHIGSSSDDASIEKGSKTIDKLKHLGLFSLMKALSTNDTE